MPDIPPPPPKGLALLRVMEKALRSGRVHPGRPETFFTYSELVRLLGGASPSYRAGNRLQKMGLDELNEWTKKHPRLPKISALIVNKKSRRPSEGFPVSQGHLDDPDWEKWWRKEAARAIQFDWSPFLAESKSPEDVTIREDEDEPSYQGIIVLDPPPAHIRRSRITVEQVLRWLANGISEARILQEHPSLTRKDIRASLAYAADREKPPQGDKRLASFTEKWGGKFKLPDKDPSDPRLTYLLEKYERSCE